MIYRSIPHNSSDDKTVTEKLLPEEVTITETTETEQTNLCSSSASSTASCADTEITADEASLPDNENGLVNINTADLKTLMTLKGIGEKKAQNIIDHRTQNGSFTSIDALSEVSGIGKKTVESLRPFITV